MPDAIEHRNSCAAPCAFATQLFDSTVRCRTLNRALLVASAKLFEHKPTGHCSRAVENGFLYMLLNRVEKGENSYNTKQRIPNFRSTIETKRELL